jgi:hypothetical protein
MQPNLSTTPFHNPTLSLQIENPLDRPPTFARDLNAENILVLDLIPVGKLLELAIGA